MPRTAAQAILDARVLINDNDPNGFRVTDADFLRWAVDALNSIRNVRPDLFLGNWGALTLDTVDTELPINEQFFVPIVTYLAGRAELTEDEAVNSGRAKLMAELMQGFLR